MKSPILQKQVITQLKQSTHNIHGQITLATLLLACCYLPIWIKISWSGLLRGHSDLFLQAGMAYLAGQHLWQQRHQIQRLQAGGLERNIGYFLVGCSVSMIPLALTSSSVQAFLVILMLSGLTLSRWGMAFFQHYINAHMMLMACIYADWTFLLNAIWDSLTPPAILEQFTAWLGALSLRLWQYQAVVESTTIRLPEGAVVVGSGCSGFDMAITLGIGGFILGKFLHMSRRLILCTMIMGIILALVMNIPRVMLLAIASVYWGKASFDFWHGPIGGQLFSSVMFTIYYYIVMAIAKPPETSVK
jgi:exosortase/archaeosortase family protein